MQGYRVTDWRPRLVNSGAHVGPRACSRPQSRTPSSQVRGPARSQAPAAEYSRATKTNPAPAKTIEATVPYHSHLMNRRAGNTSSNPVRLRARGRINRPPPSGCPLPDHHSQQYQDVQRLPHPASRSGSVAAGTRWPSPRGLTPFTETSERARVGPSVHPAPAPDSTADRPSSRRRGGLQTRRCSHCLCRRC
jgi:hypothetical protein